jgi:uncharacterized membrane protein
VTSPADPLAGPPAPILHVCDVIAARTGRAEITDDVPIAQRTASLPVPRSRASRLIGVDATRGIALLGMFAVHVLPTVDADGSPSLSHTLAGGKSAATFAVLAGVGIAFMTGGRRRPHGPARRAASAALGVRALGIGVLGFALGYASFDTVGVILAFYAVLFLLAIPLIGLGSRVLLAVALAISLVVPVLSHVMRVGLPSPSLENPSFAHLIRDPVSQIVELSLTGLYPALPWAAYICTGLAVGRLRLSSLRPSARRRSHPGGRCVVHFVVAAPSAGRSSPNRRKNGWAASERNGRDPP